VTTVDDERERTAHHHATPRRRTTILAIAIVGFNDRAFALVGIFFLLNLVVYDV